MDSPFDGQNTLSEHVLTSEKGLSRTVRVLNEADRLFFGSLHSLSSHNRREKEKEWMLDILPPRRMNILFS